MENTGFGMSYVFSIYAKTTISYLTAKPSINRVIVYRGFIF